MRLYAIYPKPCLSQCYPEHKKYPYLLKGVTIDHSDQAWCSDITYLLFFMSYILIFRFWSDATRYTILTIHKRLPISGTINFLNRRFLRIVWANILDKETVIFDFSLNVGRCTPNHQKKLYGFCTKHQLSSSNSDT